MAPADAIAPEPAGEAPQESPVEPKDQDGNPVPAWAVAHFQAWQTKHPHSHVLNKFLTAPWVWAPPTVEGAGGHYSVTATDGAIAEFLEPPAGAAVPGPETAEPPRSTAPDSAGARLARQWALDRAISCMPGSIQPSSSPHQDRIDGILSAAARFHAFVNGEVDTQPPAPEAA